MNPFDISEPCIKIARSEVLLEQYIMAINQDKYDIEVRNYYVINLKQIFFDFMLRMFNCLGGLCIHEKCILIDTIKWYKLRNQSGLKIENYNREKRTETKKGRYI